MLNAEQAAVVKGLLARGEKQHDIAAYYGENGGRIADIAKGRKHADVRPAPKSELPTPAQLVPWGFIMAESLKALAIVEMAVGSARTRLAEVGMKLQAAAEIERTGRRKARQ